MKNRLQEAGVVEKAPGRGKHRKRRSRAAWPGMMLLRHGSTHERVPGQYWELIVTMDDATNEHYAMFFVEEEGTASSLRGVKEVIEKRGLFASFYTELDTLKTGAETDPIIRQLQALHCTRCGVKHNHAFLHIFRKQAP